MPNLPALTPVPDGGTWSLYQPGDIWSHAQCPAPAAWTPSGTICVQICVALDSWNSGTAQTLLAQWTSTADLSWRFLISSAGSLQFANSSDGATAGVTHAIAYATLGSPLAGAKLTLRAVRKSSDSGNTTTSFWVSTDYNPVTKTGTWTQKGSTQTTAGVTSIFHAAKAVQLGTYQQNSTAGSNLPAPGKFYWANIYDGADDTGTLVAMVDNRTPWAGYQNTTGFQVDTSASANKWTLQGPAARWKYDYPVNATTTIQPNVPMTTKAGWAPLAMSPLVNVPTNGGTTWAAGNWKFMPFTAAAMSPIVGIAVETSAAATGGTCALQFAIYKADATGGLPGTLVQDLVGLGTIDLTATLGVQTLTFAALTALADGNYYIGAMWQGTATGKPNLYVSQGNHPSVSMTTAARNINAYTQVTSSVPSPAAASATGSGLIVWYKQ